ncbi:MAG: flavin reductase family protein [Pseudomonadota bacterium]
MSQNALQDAAALRAAFGAFLTGVTIVTTRGSEGGPVGFTANSFTSVSLDPPLLLFCISRRSASLSAFQSAPGFAVNILSKEQETLSTRFAGPSENRFAGIGWRSGETGAPLLDGVCGWFDCRPHQIIEAGDHHVIIGEVVAFERTGEEALGYGPGGYFAHRRAGA